LPQNSWADLTREIVPEIQPIHALSRAVQARRPLLLQQLEQLVCAESPTDDKRAVDAAATLTADWFQAAGATVRRHRQKEFGDLLEMRFPAHGVPKSAPPILLLGHLDTVWPAGTLKTMPFRVTKSRAYGPGVLDMKAGVVMALHAMEALQATGMSHPPVIVLLNSEEEVGSPVSRPVTEKLAEGCRAVFVLEPAQGPQGAYKTARKGVGDYTLRVTGVAAHSGVDFAKGHSAVLELARLLLRVAKFTDLKTGLTVNPGVIRGGTRVNVVAAAAEADVDVRIARSRDAARVERMFHALRPTDRACTLTITGGLNRPPMERTAAIAQLFRQAKALAAGLGIALEEASTGGGSDGNFTAALGIPTLDGMGACGEGAHADHESIELDSLVPRTALLAAMIQATGISARETLRCTRRTATRILTRQNLRTSPHGRIQ
jgi:glutamate carboxypeptidase